MIQFAFVILSSTHILSAPVITAPSTIIPIAEVSLGIAVLGLLDVDFSELLGGSGQEVSEDGESGDEFDDNVFFDTNEDLGDDSDLGEFDDSEGDEFGEDGDLGDGFENASEEAKDVLEPRIDEIESDVEGISNTISTVRSENEAIKESVTAVEENVRKLLEVYEIVTSGANPFSDGPTGLDSEERDFGFFFDEPASTDNEEPESSDAGEDEVEDIPEGFFEEEKEDSANEPEDGTTFEELKAEYEADTEANTPDMSDVDEEDFVFNEAIKDGDDPEHNTDSDDQIPSDQNNHSSTAYLTEIPTGYGADLILLEWLEYLTHQGGMRGTHRSIEYYQNLSWISDDVAGELRSILIGMSNQNGQSDALARTDGSGEPRLGIEHHRKSLEYISLLTGREFTPRSFEMPRIHRYGI